MTPLKRILTAGIPLAFLAASAPAHHGGVSLAFGPGSPIETNSPLSLPKGGTVLSFRSEQVAWRSFGFAEPENKESYSFYNMGISYGFTSFLGGTLFVPYNIKRQDSLGAAEGVGDLRAMVNLGFHHDADRGWGLNALEDTAVSLEGRRETFFSLYGGVSFPTGKDDIALGGEVDPGMQPGFGSPAYSLGFSAGRSFFRATTLVADVSTDLFTTKSLPTGEDFRFGNEWRLNLAVIQELYGRPDRFVSKVDGIFELNGLGIARDEVNGEGQEATGGKILYAAPGLRLALPRLGNANLGLLFKVPAWKDLNEEADQQGAEGLERYRVVATLSFYL